MDSWFIISIIIAFVAGIILGWSARGQEKGNERNTSELNAVLRADLKYLKRGIEDLRREQRQARQMLCDLLPDAKTGNDQTEQALISNGESTIGSAAKGEEP